jgi:hypothetical protein
MDLRLFTWMVVFRKFHATKKTKNLKMDFVVHDHGTTQTHVDTHPGQSGHESQPTDISHGTHHTLTVVSYNVTGGSNFTPGTHVDAAPIDVVQTPSTFTLPTPPTTYSGAFTDPAQSQVQFPGINWDAVFAGK